jgi:hypothetical protein
MTKPNFEKLIPLITSNENFSVTEQQYQSITGTTMPKDPYYLKNQSALSKFVKKYGYLIEVVPQEKTVSLKRKEQQK